MCGDVSRSRREKKDGGVSKQNHENRCRCAEEISRAEEESNAANYCPLQKPSNHVIFFRTSRCKTVARAEPAKRNPLPPKQLQQELTNLNNLWLIGNVVDGIPVLMDYISEV